MMSANILHQNRSICDDWHKIARKVVEVLKWKRLTIVYNSSEPRFTSDTVLDSFCQMGIPLAIAEDTTALQRAIVKTKSTTFVVWGTADDVSSVLQEVSQVASDVTNLSGLTAYTEWILAISSGNSSLMMTSLCEFRNVIIMQNETGETGVWTLEHGNRCQLSSLSPLLSSGHSVTRQDIYPYAALRDFRGQTLRVAVREYIYYIRNFSHIDGHNCFEGVLVDLLQELSVRLNFSYTLIYSPDTESWGQDSGNGQWDGLIGMLIRNEADIALGPLSMTLERSLVADPTVPYMSFNGRIIFKTRDQRSGYPRLVWKPFRPLVYGVIGCCFLLVLSLLWVCELQKHLPTSSRGLKVQKPLTILLKNVEVLLASLTNRATEHEMRSRPGVVLLCSWLGLCVLLTSLYSGNLTSSLTVSEPSAPFTSLAELLAQDTYTWGFTQGTAFASELQTSKIPIYREFYEGALKHAESDPDVLSTDPNVIVRKIKDSRFAFFGASADVYHLARSQDCAISFLKEDHYDFRVCYLQKSSPYTAAISEQIRFMREAGLIDYWIKQWRPDGEGKCDLREKQNTGSFALEDLQEAFYLVASGIAAAFLALALECFVFARKFLGRA